MHVLHVSPLYWPSLGGGEQVTQVISERMARDGHAVTVLTTDASSEVCFWDRRSSRVAQPDEWINGVHVIRVPVRPFPMGRLSLFVVRGLAIRVLDPLRLQNLVRRIGAWMPHAPSLKQALRNLADSFDLIHGFNLSWESCLVDAYDFARARSRVFIATPFLHTGEPGRARVSRNYQMSHQRAALRGSDRVIAQTQIEARAIERMGIARSRIVEVGVGIDPVSIEGGQADRFRSRYDLHGPIVAFIGRVMRDKGAMSLVRAMQQVWAAGMEVEVVMAGSPMPDFKHFLERQSLPPHLHVLGSIDAADKRDLLAAADVLAMPSRAESFGIVYLEAWAYAKPVIGARAGGVPDVIEDGVDGWLVEFDDVADLAQRITQLILNPAEAKAMGMRGYQKLQQRYTWDRLYRIVQNTYGEAVDQAQSAGRARS
jgi:glycosyltransferase involved in cell wall biosynthesis